MNKQKQAINDYLQALLVDPSDEAVSVSEVQVETKIHTLGLENLVAEVLDTAVESTEPVGEVRTEVQQQASAAPEDLVEEEPVKPAPCIAREQTAEIEISAPVKVEEIVPDWAQQAFQCLLFKVSGLMLAVPLIKLNSVMPWTDKLVATPNKTDWYLGLVNNHGVNVKVIDTAVMVLPENRHVDLSVDLRDRFSHVLLVNDCRWGLACDSIGEVIWLHADQVKWRNNKTRRPWLAGTFREHLCALMDTEVFADMMDQKVTA